MIRRRLAVVMIVFVCALAAHPAGAATKSEKIYKLMELTGAQARMVQIYDLMMPSIMHLIEQANPNIPKDVIQSFTTLGRQEYQAGIPDVMPVLEKIYETNFTDEEIDAMLDFYGSAVGQSVIKKLPILTTESVQAGRVWGRQIGQRVANKIVEGLRRKGYDAHI